MISGTIVQEPLLRLDLFGIVRGWASNGADGWPRGRRAQAILAYLALTEGGTAPRSHLMRLLWSTRGEEQARASLRQSLMELRRAMDAVAPRILDISKLEVKLDRGLVWLDGMSRHEGEAAPDAPAGDGLFLESLTGLDPHFDAWIDRARAQLAGRNTPVATPVCAAADDVPAAAAAPVRLVVAIQPFEAAGPLDGHAYLPTSLAHEMVNALARFRWFLVRAAGPTRSDSADYTVQGFVRATGSGFRINVRLAEPACGTILWAHQSDADMRDLDAAIGDIAERIVGELDPQILAIETRKAQRKAATDCAAYECVLRALPLLYSFEQDAWRTAVNLLDQAMATDPDYGRGFAFAALARFTGVAQGWLPSSPETIDSILACAARAVERDPNDSLALAIAGHNLVFTTRDFERAITMFDTALRCNPNCGYAWAYSSLTYAYLGKVEDARMRLARARELLLYDPFGSFLDTFAAVIGYFAGEWADTIELCRRQLIARPGFANMRKILIAALAQAGLYMEARQQHEQLMGQEPGFAWAAHLRSYPFGRESDREALATALRRAALLDAAKATGGAAIISLSTQFNQKRNRP